MCLLHLYQRLLVAAPLNHLSINAPPSASISPPAPIISPTQGLIEPESRQQSWNTFMPIPPNREISMSFESGKKRSSRFSAAKITLFRRSKAADEVQPRIVDESDVTEERAPSKSSGSTLRGESNRGSGPLSRMNSTSTGSSPNIEPDNPEFNPWNMEPGTPSSSISSHRGSQSSNIPQKPHQSPRPNSDHRFSQSSGNSWQSNITPDMPPLHHTSHSYNQSLQRSPSILETTTTTGGGSDAHQRNYLPGENNNFAGFCKGAWKLQIGEKKNAMEIRARPAAVYVKNNQYYKCKKCNFEGQVIEDAKGRRGVDTRVYSAEGIRYRWEFLFKSHVQIKGVVTNVSAQTFGCIFCCAEGRGTPTFGGLQSFMAHLQEHRGRLPTGEVLYRTNCIVGEVASPERDFDINLQALPPSEDIMPEATWSQE